jgi:DNA (cytosine-5)-methyltransferase 1
MVQAHPFTYIDLFSGIGGFKSALDQHNGKSLGFSEVNKDAIKYYCINYNETVEHNFGDIRDIKSLPKHDLMTAGVPCQSWSIAGSNLGFDDDRGQLWNDTIFLLKSSQPKAFIFENVKGLADPRNKKNLEYILNRIEQAGYFARCYLLNSKDYGLIQSRVRLYIIGFREKKYFERFNISPPIKNQLKLSDVILITNCTTLVETTNPSSINGTPQMSWSLSNSSGLNDYFLFNDLRNGHTTIHSWDIIKTSDKEKHICYLLLRNRRKKQFGKLDGNPISLKQFQSLDPSITQRDLESLEAKGILQKEKYKFKILTDNYNVGSEEEYILNLNRCGELCVDDIKTDRNIKIKKINIEKNLLYLEEKGILHCCEIRYDFKHTKISTGLFGINRIFLPHSKVFPTLVASDTNDFIATKSFSFSSPEDYREKFLSEIYQKGNYRKVSKKEACILQGFSPNFKLPEQRAKWMHLIGNSVSVPLVSILCESIIRTGVFGTISDNMRYKSDFCEHNTIREHTIREHAFSSQYSLF